MSKNFSDFFIEFVNYIKEKTEEKKEYLNYYNALATKLINLGEKKQTIKSSPDPCIFLDDDKTLKKFKKIINENLCDDKSASDQIKNISVRFDEIKIEEILSTNAVNYNELLEKISNVSGVEDIKNITIGNLKTYYTTIYTKYFRTSIKIFLENFFVDEDKKKRVFEDLDLWLKTHKDDSIPNIPSIGLILTPYSYLTKDKCYAFEIEDNKLKISQQIETRNMEQSDIYEYPNIQIFCSTIDNLDEVNNYAFNRFIFLHEFGHKLTFRDNTTIDINGEKYQIPTKYELDKYFNYFENSLDLKTKEFLSINKINDIINPINRSNPDGKNSYIFFDLNADLLATKILVDELTELKINDNDILNIIISIIVNFSTDSSHLNTKTRVLINIFSNIRLREIYLKTIPNNVSNDKLCELKKNINQFYEKLEIETKKITEINLQGLAGIARKKAMVKLEKDNSEFKSINKVKIQIKDLLPNFEYGDVNLIYYLDNIDEKNEIIKKYNDSVQIDYTKVEKFFKDLVNIHITESNKDNYYNKYLKYKSKYLELKKLIHDK